MSVPERRHYDPGEHLIAARIQTETRRWLILWGPYSREFFAFSLLPGVSGRFIHAKDHWSLLRTMGEIEMQYPQPEDPAR